MNKKLSYHADKMQVVCILLAVVMGIVLIGQFGTAIIKYTEYYENPYFKSDDIYDITGSVIENLFRSIIICGLPLGASIYIYIKGKDRKADLYRLFGIFVLTEVVLEIYQLIRTSIFSFSLSDIENFADFIFLLLPIVSLSVGLYCLKIGKYKFFKAACILFLVFPCISWIKGTAGFTSEIMRIIENFYGFADMNELWLRIAGFVLPIINTVAYALLFFKAFSLTPSVEEQLKQLNAALSDGAISQEQYDEQRQKLLEEL